VRRILLEHGDDPAVVGIMDSAGNRN
jgi:hypothetical protein